MPTFSKRSPLTGCVSSFFPVTLCLGGCRSFLSFLTAFCERHSLPTSYECSPTPPLGARRRPWRGADMPCGRAATDERWPAAPCRYLFRKLAAYQAIKRGTASLAPGVQYSFASARFAGAGSPTGTLHSDPSISELLALSPPLSPAKADAGSPRGPGTKPPPPTEGASQPSTAEAMGRSPLGRAGRERGDRSSTKDGGGGGRMAGPGRASGMRAAGVGSSRLTAT